MRLSRTFLVLAAGLTASVSAANITVDADRTISSLSDLTGNNFAIGNGANLVIDLRNPLGAPIDATFNGLFQDGSYVGGSLVPGIDGTGFLVKAGGGTLQYNGFSNLAYLGNRSFDGGLLSPLPADLRPLVAGGLTNTGAQQGFAGIVVVQQGQLQVSGHINQWADYGAFNAQMGVGGVMLGAAATVVDAGAKLSFRNTLLNLPGAEAQLDDTEHNNPATPLVGRLNYLNNVRASTASRVETGSEDTNILVLHSDMPAVGLGFTESTLGILEGKGRVYKTGATDLLITNAATFTGEFVASGGRLLLAAGSGDTLWSAKSVNLASGGQGTNVGFAVGDGPAFHWKPSYAPGNAGVTTLVVQGAQRIRNFQSLYGDAGFNAILAPGTGAGNFVELASAADTLTVDHEAGFDGYFTGSFVGAVDLGTGLRGEALGTLIKTGEDALALISVGNNMSRLEIRAGRLISNVQSLGSGEAVLSGTGSLTIVQNNSGALRAIIRSAAGATATSLVFRPTDSIQYRGAAGARIGNDDEGLVDIVSAQPFFLGQVIVEDGNDIAFSAGNNNAFENAAAIILREGASRRETSIRFNDTNQLVRNLEGAASSRIYLGRGDITLVNASATTYAGGISGVGNLIKSGPNAFTLSGTNNYYGATVVRDASLSATSAAGIGNTSGLIVAADAAFSGSSSQSIGALFGQAGSTVTVAGALTVGISDDLRSRLVAELVSLPGSVPATSAAYYLATEFSGALPGFDFSPATTLGYLVRQYGLVADDATEAQVAAYLDADGSGAATLDDLTPSDIEANRDLLGFSGALSLGGALTKTGSERLTLLGSVTFTGADKRVIVEQGTLQVSLSALGAASAVILGDRGTLSLGVTAPDELPFTLSGTGTFTKTGAGSLSIDREVGAPAFDGLYDVLGGSLTVIFGNSTVPGLTREGSVATAAGTSFTADVRTNLAWAGEVYGEGDFIKIGGGVLTLTSEAVSPIYTTGKVRVLAGGLTAAATPEADLEIAAGATYTAKLLQDDFFDGVLSGAGSLVKQGDFDLRLETVATFSGAVDIQEGSLSLGAADALVTAGSITLAAGTTLIALDGLAQSLTNVSAPDDSTLITSELPGTELTFNATAAAKLVLKARITGLPVLVKTGAGELFLDRRDLDPNDIQGLDIQEGTLKVNKDGIGDSDATIALGATLVLDAPKDKTDVYGAGNVFAGAGRLAKTGEGTVDVTAADLTGVGAEFDVSGGTLVISRATISDIPKATLSNGATLYFRTDRDLVLDTSGVIGDGDLRLGGAFTIDLAAADDGQPGYGGSTILVDGVTVALVPSLILGNRDALFGGIASEAGTTLDTSGVDSAEFVLVGKTAFAGGLTGDADLILSGEGTLDFTDTDVDGDTDGRLEGYAGTVEISGATALLSVANLKEITLNESGRIELRGAGTSYTALLQGDGTGIVALGDGVSLDLANPTSLDSPAVARVDLLAGSTLTMTLVDGAFTDRRDVSLSGGTFKVALGEATGTLALVSPTADSTVAGSLELTTALGAATVTITGSVSGGLEVGANITAIAQGDLRGDVDVDKAADLELSGVTPVAIGGDVILRGGETAPGSGIFTGATLSGAGSIAKQLTVERGATLAPGFSPGTVTVGSLVNSGLLDMELGAAAYDRILFNNTAELNNGDTGTLRLKNLDTVDLLIAKRFSIVAYQPLPSPAPGDGAFIGSGAAGQFKTVTSDAPVIIFYPSSLTTEPKLAIPGLSRDGEVAAYVVRTEAAYAGPLAGNPQLSNVQDATKVTYDSVAKTTTLAPTFNEFGARLAVLDDASLRSAVDKLVPRGHAAALSAAALGFRSHADTLQRRLEQRRFDGADMSVKEQDWFVDAAHDQLDLDNGHEARSNVANAGLIRPMGVDGYWAVSLGVENAKADAGSMSYEANGFRLGGALGVMNVDRTLSLDAGLSVGQLSGDMTRPSILGGLNTADAKSTTLGLWVRASAATSVAGIALTPFVALEHSQTSMDETREPNPGQLGDSLTVRDADHTQTSARAGFGLHHAWISQGGDWRYRLGLEVAYSMQVDGDDATLSAYHEQLRGSDVSQTFKVLPGDGFSVAPTFTFGPSPDSTFTVGLRLEQGSEGEATSLQLGYRRKF